MDGQQQASAQCHGQPAVYIFRLLLEENNEKCELLLGVEIQANLKWNTWIKIVTGKLKNRLVGLNKLKFLVPYQTRNTIVIGIFNSVLVYCLPLFGGCNKGQVKDLQVLQNKAGQIVGIIFLGLMSVAQLLVYHTILMVFKIRKSGEPEYLADYLKNDGRTGKIIVPNTKLGLVQKSFCFRGSDNWNSLPESLRTCMKIGTFKLGLKKWILQNTSRFKD